MALGVLQHIANYICNATQVALGKRLIPLLVMQNMVKN
ncbi:hypothetical protein SC10_B2orf04806 [Bacillus paralicheniformis]|uniref:Uncharacterized protein n=1 Tax=Bacillus paralicheniformis TaxID=1648923 RepID=A0ABY3G0F7_9BACI|nr:hypothetical protein SC10_B2orf04806 [Bacillus paralicheniformis]TWL42346.1 hypothetical protein CHCC15381_3708 [Bacillus paralicheniformis]